MTHTGASHGLKKRRDPLYAAGINILQWKKLYYVCRERVRDIYKSRSTRVSSQSGQFLYRGSPITIMLLSS